MNESYTRNVATIAMYMAIGANGVVKGQNIDLDEVGGHIGLMSDLAEMAERAEAFIWGNLRAKNPNLQYPGVLEYEVCEDYGRFYVENLSANRAVHLAELYKRIEDFFAKDDAPEVLSSQPGTERGGEIRSVGEVETINR